MAKVKRQPKLPGTNSDPDKELEDAIGSLAEASATLSAAHEAREDAAIAMREVMERKGVATYTSETLRPAMTATLKPSEVKVSIKKSTIVDETPDE